MHRPLYINKNLLSDYADVMQLVTSGIADDDPVEGLEDEESAGILDDDVSCERRATTAIAEDDDLTFVGGVVVGAFNVF